MVIYLQGQSTLAEFKFGNTTQVSTASETDFSL